jgi:RHS repeat-associated protein
VGGSVVPETAFTASYDDANRMTSLTLTDSGQSFVLAYDDNGNLASKTDQANPSSVTSYSWDSRNRLTGMTAPGIAASFTYDGLGRRISKTVNGQAIGYVYDGMQAIGEVVGGSIDATLLTGLMIDEVIARYGASGNRTYLTDALGSVLALSKDDQSIQNFYEYSAYGETRALGDDEGNPIQYTGRENDRTGLHYYRARYYDPGLKRFISEDPIGVEGGVNLFLYVGGNPISFNDPLGFAPPGLNPPSQSSRIGNLIRNLIGPKGSEAGTGAEAGTSGKSGASGAQAGQAIGKRLCVSGLSNQGLWSDCTQECVKTMSAGSGGSEPYIECANACEDAYKKCKKSPPQTMCPPPIFI